MPTLTILDGLGAEKQLKVSEEGTSIDPFVHLAHPGDIMLDIPAGNIPGSSSVNKFGASGDIPADATEDVWSVGGDYVYPTTADITHIHQVTDQVDLRGADIEIQGLDINWELVVQTVALNASNTTTIVGLTTPLLRVFRAKVMANFIGTSDILVTNAGGTITYTGIPTGENQTLMALYTVPAGKTAYLTKYYCTVVEATGKEPKSTRFKVKTADPSNGIAFQAKHAVGIPKAGSMAEHNFLPYVRISEKVDIKISANPTGEVGDVAAGFDLILVDNI